ncbi:MAG: hypothetical protein COV37_05045 [Bdellovibrio sp. CG11_big_fil_rev_8_21_14_0_20_39_38]|nr:MAG: hypothetical protein COW78_10660 [Bdellovibrio sp. CG22_combo_CG10-13_8_21_14_all_39_27]PIR36113.1 MAG: hypothetical protein COV37_05045 [Bdellovibrio sp. CG11_big_fil_rev_8_21_14_0_20_39_38]
MISIKKISICLFAFFTGLFGSFYIKSLNIIHPDKLLNFSFIFITGLLYLFHLKKITPFNMRQILNILGFFVIPFYAICSYESFKNGMTIFGILYLSSFIFYFIIIYKMDRQAEAGRSN